MTLEESLRLIIRESTEPLRAELAELRAELARAGGNAGPSRSTSLLTVDDVSRQCQVNAKTVRRWVHEGKLAACWAGREMRVRPADLETFLSRPDCETIDESAVDLAGRLLRRAGAGG